ncbi:MAG: peptidoglycan DD-metalloendopeptidase family protein [Butyricicoccus sp.]|nr:peptidoglycan DD-metalloendopeptidase family protein [Butyricicoccus sp.]
MLSKKAVRTIAAAIAIILVVTIAGGSLISAIGTAQAASVSELKGKISSIDKQRAEIQAVIDDLEGQINSNTKKLQALKTQMSLTEEDIEATETVIVRLADEIETKEEEIVVAQEELDEKTEIFETRMRVMYENGNDISYLDVILGSNSFGEMLSRMEIVSEVMESDKKVVSDFKEAKQKLEDAKAELEQDKADQEEYKSTLESKYDALVSQKQEVQKLTDKLESDRDQAQKEEDELEAEQERISDEIAEISRREAEAAKKAAEEAAKKKQQSSNSGSSGGSSSGGSVSASGMVWPAPSGSAGSGYGWRIHPIYGTRKFHKGTDIPAPGGSPVLAAKAGTVVQSYYSSSYGNYIVISHGGGMMTAYAHLSSRLVSAGASVSAGQQIGKVGSTGNSTGNHLHFEVYINGSTVNPMNYF